MSGFTIQYPTLYSIVGSLPASGATGQMVFLTSDTNLYIYYSGSWHVVGSGGEPDGDFDLMDGTDFEFMDGNDMEFMAS